MDAFTLVAKLTLNKDEFDSGLKQVEGTLNSNDTKSAFSAWGVTVGNLASQAFTKVFRAGVDFMKSVLTTGMNFDQMMSSVKAVGNMGEQEFERVRQKAIDLGASTKFTAEEVGEAFYYMGLAGWNTEEMLSGIGGVLDLAAASGENLGRTSDIVTDAITAMGLTAEDTTRFVNVLAAASTNSNTTVGMMGEAFKYLATTGGVLEYSIEDVATVLGLLANNGIKASQAGTSMRQILNTLIHPTDAASKAMEKLGISIWDMDASDGKIGGRKPLMQVVEELRELFQTADFDLKGKPYEEVAEAIDKLNAEWDEQYANLKKNGAGKREIEDAYEKYLEDFKDIVSFNEAFLGKVGDIGGLRGISSLFALMKSTDDDVNQLVDAVNSSSEGKGTAAEMATTMLDNLKGDVTILNSAIDGLKIAMFDEINPAARTFVETITDGATKMTNFIKHGQLEWTAEDVEHEAIGNAEAIAAEGQGIVNYMDSLIAQYGDAATNSKEWADAMDRLKELFPQINEYIKTEGTNLSENTGIIRDYIEMSRQKAIEDAKKAYLGDLQEQYRANQIALGQLEVGQEQAVQTQIEDARRMAQIYFRNRQSAETKFGAGYREQTDEFAAYNTVEEIISALQEGKVGLDSFMSYLEASEDELDIPTLKALREQYEASQQTYDANAQQIKSLTDEALNLQTQLSVAEAAVARMAEAANSFDPSAGAYPQAKGDWFVPYDNYPSLLHRGEMVLTASQARQYREGNGGFNSKELYSMVASAVAQAVSNIQINMDGRQVGNAVTDQVSRNIYQAQYERRFTTA